MHLGPRTGSTLPWNQGEANYIGVYYSRPEAAAHPRSFLKCMRRRISGFAAWITNSLGTGEEHDFAIFFERRQAGDSCPEFHSVVGGGRFAPGEFSHVIAVAQACSPTTRSGISVTCPVGMNRYLFQESVACPFQNRFFGRLGKQESDCWPSSSSRIQSRQAIGWLV